MASSRTLGETLMTRHLMFAWLLGGIALFSASAPEPGSAAEPAGRVGSSASSKWEPAIAAFEAEDKQSPPPKDADLFVGSSSIRLWDLKKSFPDLPTINRGFGGS